MLSLIREPAYEWAAGQQQVVSLTPLTLPSGRTVADFNGYTLTIRADPDWPRAGAAGGQEGAADPIGDGWAVSLTASGSLVGSVPTFTFTVPSDAGIRRYAVDCWASLTSGGEVQLVRATWLTVGARVKSV